MFQRFHQANEWAKKQIKMALTNKYPHIHWSDEEISPVNPNHPEFLGDYWVCDPVDSGIHLHQGFSFWSMSLCLIRDGQPVFALVYDPNREEFFHAIQGKGAYLNNKPIHVTQKTNLSDTILATAPSGWQESEITPLTVQGLSKLTPITFAVRMLGSVALQLAYVACGRLDGYWEYGENIYDWLGAAFLVKEAGGIVSDPQGHTFTWGTTGIIASNPLLQKSMVLKLAE